MVKKFKLKNEIKTMQIQSIILKQVEMASNSFVIICKKYYVEVILRQITVITDENHTYCKVDKCCD